jgi:hypothetical protein
VVGISAGSTLVVTAAAGANDNLEVRRPSPTTLRVTDSPSGIYGGSGLHPGAGGCTRSGDYTIDCAASPITAIRMSSADRIDQLVNSTAIKSTLDGGAAADTLIGGSSADTLTGAAGVDTSFGMNGNDLLKARDGLTDQTINCDGGTSPSTADRVDLDKLPKDPNSKVIGCETKTRH